MAKIARMRTIDGLWREIHFLDPSSQVSKNFLRKLVVSGKVRSVKSGLKYLVDLDTVLNYLTDPPDDNDANAYKDSYGKLRRIN